MDMPKLTSLLGRRVRLFLLGLLGLVVFFGAFGYFAGPPIARSVLVKVLAQQLHRPVSLGAVHINPYAMSVRLTDLKVGAAESGEIFGFDELLLDVDIASLLHAAPVVEEVRLVGPRVHLIREAPGRFNISDLLEQWLKPSDSPTPLFSVNNIKVTKGRFDFDDRPVGKQHTVADINIALPFISNLAYQANLYTEPAFSCTINGAPLELKGKTKPFAEAHESELQLGLNHIDLSHYLAYSPVPLPFTVTGGQLDTNIRVVFRQAPKEAATLNLEGQVTLRGLHLLEDGKTPLLNLVKLELPLKGIAPLANRFQFGSVTVDGLELFVRVAGNGNLNWQTVASRLADHTTATTKSSSKTAPAKPANDKTPPKPMELALGGFCLSNAAVHWQDGAAPNAGPSATLERFEVKAVQVDVTKQHAAIGELALTGLKLGATRLASGHIAGLQAMKQDKGAAKPDRQKKPGPTAPAWTLDIGKSEITSVSLRLDDKAVQQDNPLLLEITKLVLGKFSTAPKTSVTLDLAALINKKGSLQVSGPLQLAPLAGKLKVDLRGLDLLPLQPYFGGGLNLTVTRGQVTSNGVLAFNALADGSLGGSFQGQLTVGNFHSIDKLNSADFLNWKSFTMDKLNVAFKPLSLSIGEVSLTDFYARIIVSPKGQLNVLQLVKKDEAAGNQTAAAPETTAAASTSSAVATLETPPAPAKPATPVRIGKVTLQGGTVKFTDNFVKPNYTAKLTAIGGRITGLSSDPGSSAEMDLRGTFEDAPLTIAGTLNPLATLPALDIKAEVHGIELTPMSPYSGKYAGYLIAKGKLSFFLGYTIVDNKLTADNRIVLNQLTFGDKVNSPDATSLPVTLAVALLKNRDGDIDINLPISGSLNDPQFSVGGIIVRVIVNLIGKALTSPFALIGSLFGGGEEMSHVDYALGQTRLTPEAIQRLEALAKALDDRPSLKLEVTGRVDPDLEREGLRHAVLERKLKAVKRGQMLKANQEVRSVDEVVISDQEYLPLLEQAYKREKFPKPRNFIGLTKSLPREEMEKLILANAPVGEAEMQDLANTRAKAVAEWLATTGKIPRERIFLLPPKQATEKPDPKVVPMGRVDFSLK